MKKLLVVEDSNFFTTLLHRNLDESVDLEVIYAGSKKEAGELIALHKDDIVLSLLDLTLPDASEIEIVDFVQEFYIPIIVFTASFNDELRDQILSRRVIDYILKDNPSSLTYLIQLIKRLVRNKTISVLVVDDSSTARKYVTDLLSQYHFHIVEASDGEEALAALAKEHEHPIRLVITDYHMPNMDGFELTQAIRKKHSPDDIAIIGISTTGSAPLSAKFIKFGANDFITKPFLREEFFCRVVQNIDALDRIQELIQLASTDPLTKLFNRRYLLKICNQYIEAGRRSESHHALGLIDADYFKEINDTYGHAAGDEVLKQLGLLINNATKRETDIPARIGGEEFCIFLYDANTDFVTNFFENIRETIENMEFKAGDDSIKITVSIGICTGASASFDEMFQVADKALFQAKKNGRNKIVIEKIDPT